MIPVNLIRQYYFCPRIVYFNLLTDIKPLYPRHVYIGEEFHQAQENLSKNRRFKKLNIQYEKILNDTYLESEKLGISGIVDLAFISKEEVIPVEYKNIKSKKNINYAHILQLCGYGLLLSEEYGRAFKRALVIYGNNIKFYQVKITSEIKNDFFKVLKEILGIVDSGIMPQSSANDAKCLQCEYLNFCDDRF